MTGRKAVPVTTPKPDAGQQPPADPGKKQEDQPTIAELAQRQERTEGKLDKILGILGDKGEHTQAHADAQDHVQDRLDRPGRIQDEMRQAVRDVRAEEAAEEARRQHDAEHQQLRKPPPETAPREVAVKGKARLQRALFGGEP